MLHYIDLEQNMYIIVRITATLVLFKPLLMKAVLK